MGFISSSSPAPKRRTEPPHPRPDASSSSERPASIASQQLPRKDVQSRHTTRNGPDQTVPIRTKFPKASAEAIGQKTTSSTATSKSKSNRTEGEGGRRPQQLSHGTRSSATPRQHSDQGSATGGPPGLGGLSVHSSVSTSGGQGTHKGKGSAWLKGIRQFPAKWGFGRPPSLTLMTRTDTTLLQLLSCRELERMPPHTTQQNQRVNPASVTKSVDYKPEDVEGNCKHWPDFTFERMVDDFPILYNTVLMPDELGPESPGFWVSNESQLHSSLDSHLLRYMRQYLRITFGTFRQQLSARGAEEVTIRNGGFTRNIKRKIPDIGVYSLQERVTLGHQATSSSGNPLLPPFNRMIVEVKPSSKWKPNWRDVENDRPTAAGEALVISSKVFYAPLAQTHYYMRNSGGRGGKGPQYGALLTDECLTPLYRPGANGELHLGEPIPWGRHFAEGQDIKDFTVQSALWYLCMLSSLPDWYSVDYRSHSSTSSSSPEPEPKRKR